MARSRVVEEPAELLAYLFTHWPETKKKQVREWLKFSLVTVNGRAVTQFNHPLKAGDEVAIRSQAIAEPGATLAGGMRVRHEDDAIIVIEKPAGLLSIATATETEKTAYALLTEHVRHGNWQSRARVWIVHRLDRETSGLMVFAKSEKAKEILQEKWDTGEKKYFAVVEGAPRREEGRLESNLDESDRFKVRSVDHSSPRTRRAITRYRVVKKNATRSLLEVTLETGRRHQIRVQLAEEGCPVVGDALYGDRTKRSPRLALHACSLRFTHPVTGEVMRFEAPLPGELGKLVLTPKLPLSRPRS